MLTSATPSASEELAEAGIVGLPHQADAGADVRTTCCGTSPRREPAARRPEAPDSGGRVDIHRVLVVEDNPVNQLVAVGLLEALGYAPLTADDGEAAVVAIAEGGVRRRADGHPDAADGRVRRNPGDPRRARPTSTMPVIAMTAAAVEGERERCLAAGMDDFLTKPVDPTALAAVLDQWIAGRRGHRAPVRCRPCPTRPSSSPVHGLELARLDELRDLDPGNTAYLDRAIGNFVANTPGTLATIRQAIADGDAATLKAVSHKLAGGALNLGVAAAGRTAQQIELVADTGSVDGVGRADRPARGSPSRTVAPRCWPTRRRTPRPERQSSSMVGGADRSSAPWLPTKAATGGISAATTLITTAAVVDHSRTTFQASRISTTHVPISTK